MKRSRLKHLLLKTLLVADSGFALFEELYDNSRSFAKNGPGNNIPRSSLYPLVAKLSREGLVQKRYDQEKLVVGLTDAGRDWILKWGDDLGKWDGVWRMVIFDVPESHRKVRRVLRARLKEWGFMPWQKSVWASKKPLTAEIRKLVGDLGVSEWVLVIESANIGK